MHLRRWLVPLVLLAALIHLPHSAAAQAHEGGQRGRAVRDSTYDRYNGESRVSFQTPPSPTSSPQVTLTFSYGRDIGLAVLFTARLPRPTSPFERELQTRLAEFAGVNAWLQWVTEGPDGRGELWSVPPSISRTNGFRYSSLIRVPGNIAEDWANARRVSIRMATWDVDLSTAAKRNLQALVDSLRTRGWL